MKKIIIIFVSLIMFSCVNSNINKTISSNVYQSVKIKMVENEKKLDKQKRQINKLHKQRKNRIKKLQEKSWK